MPLPTISWTNNSVKIIDQTLLPNKLEFAYCRDVKTLWEAIRELKVRGAPALGAAAALGILLGFKSFRGETREDFDKHVKSVCQYIGQSRPTAVNLFNALARMRRCLAAYPDLTIEAMKRKLKQEALAMLEEDRRVCRQMGEYGAELVPENGSVMTICNAGALATVDYGTALGVFYKAKEKNKKFRVFACETRPLLQGARLTTWELLREGIDTTLICDNMAAALMKQGKIDAVFTGADRIAANGDTANKIGTYNLAVLSHYHHLPFYIVAPFSTFDLTIPSGRDIPIEERNPEEVTHFGFKPTAPKNVKVTNPAFDVTDHALIKAIVTEAGIIKPPFKKNIKQAFSA